MADYVADFNSTDEEIYVQMYDNSEAEDFMKENIPFFECPDKELEKTYYFRWWTYRKHIKETPEGYGITEFLPDVHWAGKYNAICCPGMHQFAEGLDKLMTHSAGDNRRNNLHVSKFFRTNIS